MSDDRRTTPGCRLAAGPWWLLFSGPIGPCVPHWFHAARIVVHGGAPCATVDSGRRRGPIVVVPPDASHAVLDRRDHALVLLVSPESVVGRQRAGGGVGNGHSLDGAHPVAQLLGALRMSNWSQADEAVRRTLERLDVVDIQYEPPWWHHRSLEDQPGTSTDEPTAIDAARKCDQVPW
jgi:hypothetical protein